MEPFNKRKVAIVAAISLRTSLSALVGHINRVLSHQHATRRAAIRPQVRTQTSSLAFYVVLGVVRRTWAAAISRESGGALMIAGCHQAVLISAAADGRFLCSHQSCSRSPLPAASIWRQNTSCSKKTTLNFFGLRDRHSLSEEGAKFRKRLPRSTTLVTDFE